MGDGPSFRVSVIHRTLTWTTGALTCVRDHYYACVYTRRLGTLTKRVSTTFLTRKKTLNFFKCSWRGSNLGSLNLESHTLPTEPPRHVSREIMRLDAEKQTEEHGTSCHITYQIVSRGRGVEMRADLEEGQGLTKGTQWGGKADCN